jgi:hypothetical protein
MLYLVSLCVYKGCIDSIDFVTRCLVVNSIKLNVTIIIIGVSLSMTVNFDEYRTVHIKIFSRFALIDRTGLNASVRTKRGRVSQEGSGLGGLDLDLFRIDSQSFYSKSVDRRTYVRSSQSAEMTIIDRKKHETISSCNNDINDRGIRNPVNRTLNDKYDNVENTLTSDCWIQGGNGMVLFHAGPLDGKASIGTCFIIIIDMFIFLCTAF